MARPIDLLLRPRWVIPIEPAGAVLEEHAVAVQDGRILAVLPAREALQRYEPRRDVELAEHVLLPGLVNLHTHAAMTLLRGYADDLPLMSWLKERIWPAEARHVSVAFVHDGTLLACAEMLRGGVTCFNDMYFFPEAAARAALELGMRAAIGIIAVEFPSAYASDADDYLSKGLATRDEFRGEPLLSFCMAPHAPYTVSDRTLSRVATFADQLGLPIHIHLHETAAEVEESLAAHGARPLARLDRLGLLDARLIAVHGVHLDRAEIARLAQRGCHIAHCPTSNLKLASGFAPVAEALAAGVCVGLGSDGAASNNRLDLFREMRHAALLGKAVSADASALDCHRVLRMATLDGAAALGIEECVGSLVPGKAADLCAVSLGSPDLAPCYDPASHLIYAAGREHVTHVWIDGQPRVEEGRLLRIGNGDLLRVAEIWHNALRES
ncbi:MAG: TRZ/ATZ family hydrolase [Rhodocyclaceae bacterium]